MFRISIPIAATLLFTSTFAAALPVQNTASVNAYPEGYYPGSVLPPKTVYLTFDDGPGDFTDDILNVLSNSGVKATFFLCGKDNWRVPLTNNHFHRYRDTLLRMVREGNTLGNHTLDHFDLATLGPKGVADEFDSNQMLLNSELGTEAPKMIFFRPPFGSPWILPHTEYQKRKIGSVIAARGYVALWSLTFDSTDAWDWVKGEWAWKGPRVNFHQKEFNDKADRILRRLLRRADGRSFVVLMHDIHPTTLRVLPALISNLSARGYTFSTFDGWLAWKTNAPKIVPAVVPLDTRR